MDSINNSGNSVNHSQNSQPAEAGGRCCICQRVFGRGVTLIPCCNNKIHRDCMQRLFQHTPLEERSTCPLCREDLPELTVILAPESSDQGTGATGMQEDPKELSYELTEALLNSDWGETDRLVRIIGDAKVSLTNEPRLVLGNMLIEARKRWDWVSVNHLLGMIQDTGTRLMDDDREVLSNMLIDSAKMRNWRDADRLLGIIRDARASLTDDVRQELNNMLVNSRKYYSSYDRARLRRIIENSETSLMDDAQREIEKAQKDLPDSYNEPADTRSSQTASASAFAATTQRTETTTNPARQIDTLLPQGPQPLSDQGTVVRGMQEGREELSYELTEALINRDWNDADRLVRIIRDAKVSLTNEPRQVLGNMLVEARKRWDWNSVGRLLGMIRDTETRLMEDAREVLSNMLIDSANKRNWHDADRLLRIIRDARASLTDDARQELNNMLVMRRTYDCSYDRARLQRIIDVSETSLMDDAQREIEEAQ